ncbi:ATPase [Sphingomonas sp. DBB INV C78]
MIDRALAPRVRERLGSFPCVALLGPRQVGKSTLAEMVANSVDGALVFNLARADDRAQLAGAEEFLGRRIGRLIVLDEISRMPELMPILRAQVELRLQKRNRVGHFLLLSSDCEWMRRAAAEHLGGHLATIDLGPFQTHELGVSRLPELDPMAVEAASPASVVDPREDEMRLWLRGGFPLSYLAENDAQSLEWRLAFIDAVIGRGFEIDGVTLALEAIRRGWVSVATHQACELNSNRIAQALGTNATQATRFIDKACDGQLMRRLPRWTANERKQQSLPGKLYIRDSGLLHALLGIHNSAALEQYGSSGESWEGHVIEALFAATRSNVGASYYRAADGQSEMDLLLPVGGQRWSFEIKKSSKPGLSKGFYAARDVLQPDRSIVIYRGTDRFQTDRTVELMSLRDATREVGAS